MQVYRLLIGKLFNSKICCVNYLKRTVQSAKKPS